MKTGDLARLLSLAAIWGGSFIFIRVLAPVLGPIATAELRLIIAGAVLSIYFRFVKFDAGWKQNWRHYFIIGIVSSAIPFGLFSYAGLYLPASLSVILNSSSPIFGAIFAALWLADPLSPQKILGLVLGMGGVALIAIKGALVVSDNGLLAALACIGAAVCYGLAGIYIKKFAPHIKSLAIAGASQLAAGLVLLPFIAVSPIRGTITLEVAANLLGLSLLCSVVAYILYYRLIADLGPSKALTVTFLMPPFGMIWGVLFLHETITLQMLAGCALIFAGTALVLLKPAR